MRGPFTAVNGLNVANNPLNLCGYVATGTTLLARKAYNGGNVDPWNAPLAGTSAAALAAGQVIMIWASNTNLSRYVTGSPDQVVGPRWVNFDGLMYGLSYDCMASPVRDVNQTYYMKPVNLLTMPPPTALSNAYGGSPGTKANVSQPGSSVSWTTGSSPLGSTTFTANGQYSDFLQLTNYGFSIPSTAVIQGIEVALLKETSTSVPVRDQHVQLLKAGTAVGNDEADLTDAWPTVTTGPENIQYGGQSDMWGTTWAPSDINNSGFGVQLSCQALGNGTRDADVYLAQITVYYVNQAAYALPTVLSNAPHGALDVKGYQSRIWLLGGVDTPGAGTTHSPNALFFTNPIASGGGTAASDWKDPVSGLTNQIVMDKNNQDFGVGLAIVRNGMVIFRRSSVWLLKGTTTANYTLIPISRETGCVDARSIVETDTGVYFMGQKGLMLTDGIKVVNVSGSAMYTLQQAIAAEQNGVINGQGGYVTAALASGGQIIISIGGYKNSAVVPLLCAMYDPGAVKGGAWTRITSQIWGHENRYNTGTNLYPGLLITCQTPKQVMAVGDQWVTVLEDWTQDTSFLLNTGLYDVLPSGYGFSAPFVSIPAVWKTKFMNAAVSATLRRRAIGKRFFLDYAFAGSGIVPATGWTLTPVDANDAQITGSAVLNAVLGTAATPNGPVSGLIPYAPNLQRENIDYVNEFKDLGFDLSWVDLSGQVAQPTNVAADVYGLGVEWQKSSDYRN